MMISCKKNDAKTSEDATQKSIAVDEDTKAYWHGGLAEISSYELVQQRYGEERHGKAVLIYVTESFDAQQLVKADKNEDSNFPVLKLNSTKSFTTGIYPYHIMQSSFLPMEKNHEVAKITASIQEWCGQSFMMLEQRDEFEIQVNSYFQQTGNQNKKLQKSATENGIWNKLRLFPRQIDTSLTKMLPSFEYLRLQHKEAKAYPVSITQFEKEDTLQTTLSYPTLRRKLTIHQASKQPYSILSWEESIAYGDSTYVTKAKKIKEMNIDYWNKNQEKHGFLRDSLKL